jgi:hypothetical protein
MALTRAFEAKPALRTLSMASLARFLTAAAAAFTLSRSAFCLTFSAYLASLDLSLDAIPDGLDDGPGAVGPGFGQRFLQLLSLPVVQMFRGIRELGVEPVDIGTILFDDPFCRVAA